MNEKTYRTLELDKILNRLAGYASFSAGEQLLRELKPTGEIEEAFRRVEETTEARTLIEENSSITLGGARDVRPYVHDAERDIILPPEHLLEIKGTLQAATTLRRAIEKAEGRYPQLVDIAYDLAEGRHIVAAVTRAIDDYAQILDTASPRLSDIRQELRVAHDRLQSKLQSIVNSSSYQPYLQEALITMRSGRYVIPIKADAKGRIKGIVHDQSSSGATLFIEPLDTVEVNNTIRELELAEQEEIQRILREITALVASEAERIIWTVEALAKLDSALARARFATDINASAPHLVAFDPEGRPGGSVELYNARHPLINPRDVVPVDVVLDEKTYALIITGPNTGGKTVTLKTIGLLTLMAQCGLHIPATEGSVLTVFKTIYADIGDEQSIEQSLSTFSGHLTNIIDILSKADEYSLVIIDELGAGTDPAEGAAIARAILNNLLERGITNFVATHYPELKLYAQNTPGLRNASVEFNVETLSPTYRLIIGLPGRSNALAIATRLGLPEHITDEARTYIGESELQADNLLDEIHRTREETRNIQDRLLATEKETSQLRAELRSRLENIETERREVIEAAREEARADMQAITTELSELRKRVRTMSPTMRAQNPELTEEFEEVQADAQALDVLIDEPVEQGTQPVPVQQISGEPVVPGQLKPGDQVFVSSLQSLGEIISIADDGEVEVQVGALRVRVDPEKLEYRSKRKAKEEARVSYITDVKGPQAQSPGMELRLIGFTVDEALAQVEEYLDRAYLSGLPFGRIVHGKGTGALRNAIRDLLRSHPLVKEYKKAPPNEGGDGATLVYLAPMQ